MITEIVTFPIPDSMTRDQVIAHFEATMPGWAANPDLIRKNYLYDPETRQGGGVYLWKTLAAAKAGHDATWCEKVRRIYGAAPSFAYFETPFVLDNTL
jgi:hypothetical protein